MCENADFVYFYIGHTAGDPPPMIPRYEFLTSLREKSPEKASSAVLDLVQRLVDAIDAVELAYDRDHNFMSSNTLIKMSASQFCERRGRSRRRSQNWV